MRTDRQGVQQHTEEDRRLNTQRITRDRRKTQLELIRYPEKGRK